MTITQLECFVEAAKVRSFSKAGTHLFISQQTVSRHIKALEEELGILLFVRGNKGVWLTAAGEVLYDTWRNLLELHRVGLERVIRLHQEEKETVRIGMTDLGRPMEMVKRALLSYNEKNPKLAMTYDVLPVYHMIERVRQGSLDLMIVYASELVNETGLNVLTVDLPSVPTGIFISKYHPLARRGQITLKDLAGFAIGTLSRDASLDCYAGTCKLLRVSHLENQIQVLEYNSRHNLELAVITGKCAALVYESMFDNYEAKLAFYPIEEKLADYDIAVAWQDEAYAKKARHIVKELKQSATAQ